MRVAPPTFRKTLASTTPWALALAFGAFAHASFWLAGEPRVHVVTMPPLPVVHVAAPATPPCSRPVRVEPAAVRVRDAAPTHARSGALVPRVDIDDVVRCPEEHRCIIDRELIATMTTTNSPHTRTGRVVPFVREGEMVGFKLYGVTPGSLPHAMGIRSGDLVRSIDGRQFNSMERAMATYTSLREASSFELEVVRGDQTLTKHYRIE